MAKRKDYGEGGSESKQNAMHQWDSVNRRFIGHSEVHSAEGTVCSPRNSAAPGNQQPQELGRWGRVLLTQYIYQPQR